MKIYKFGDNHANLMFEVKPNLEEAVFFGDNVSVYENMPKYEAAEVTLKAMSDTEQLYLVRGAIRGYHCDYCDSMEGDFCRFSTRKAGSGSIIDGAHFARQIAALLDGWKVESERSTYGELMIKAEEPVDITESDEVEEEEEIKKTEVVPETITANDSAILAQALSPDPISSTPANYNKVCNKCGKPIPRTGKRGRPPLFHVNGCPV